MPTISWIERRHGHGWHSISDEVNATMLDGGFLVRNAIGETLAWWYFRRNELGLFQLGKGVFWLLAPSSYRPTCRGIERTSFSLDWSAFLKPYKCKHTQCRTSFFLRLRTNSQWLKGDELGGTRQSRYIKLPTTMTEILAKQRRWKLPLSPKLKHGKYGLQMQTRRAFVAHFMQMITRGLRGEVKRRSSAYGRRSQRGGKVETRGVSCSCQNDMTDMNVQLQKY